MMVVLNIGPDGAGSAVARTGGGGCNGKVGEGSASDRCGCD
jgi:hypothetical protein